MLAPSKEFLLYNGAKLASYIMCVQTPPEVLNKGEKTAFDLLIGHLLVFDAPSGLVNEVVLT
jgi:hypothetical protein